MDLLNEEQKKTEQPTLKKVISCLIVVFTLFIAIWRILLWEIINPFLLARINNVIDLLNISRLDFEIPWTFIVRAMSSLVIVTVPILLLSTGNRQIRNGKFWLFSSPLWAILIIAMSSQLWSLMPDNTAKRSLFLLAVSLGGIFIGLEFSRSKIIWMFEVFSVFCVISSYIIVFLYPQQGIMTFDTPGAWQGLFNYKSFSGVMIAFAGVMFLFRLSNFKKEKWYVWLYASCFLLISLYFLYRTKNATALISFIVCLGVFAAGLFFIKFNKRLRPVHWWLIGGAVVVFILVAWLERNAILGLLGRKDSLTGRVPLWIALIPFIKQRLFLGYGFGEVLWYTSFLEEFWKVAPWKASLAHSGYVEALLDTGLVGFLFYVAFIFELGLFTVSYFLKQRNLYSLIFFVWFIYVVLTNITENLLGTYESFNWLLLVISFVFTLRERIEDKGISSVRLS